MSQACRNCPFRRKGGVRGLAPERVESIVTDVLNDRFFSCHEYVYKSANNPVCRGSLDFVSKQIDVFILQHARMAANFDMWKPSPNDPQIFDTVSEMIENQQVV